MHWYILSTESEWDEAKKRSNQDKHGISFEEAGEIFERLVLMWEDTRHDYRETRYISVGEIGDSVVLVHTPRGRKIRIISARRANPQPKKAVTILIDSDVQDWFKNGGKGYQSWMNAVLRFYMESPKAEGRLNEQNDGPRGT